MNILFYRYNSICEPDILEVFKSLGHNVHEITEEVANKDIQAKELVDLISAALNSQRYRMVFSINFSPLVSDVCNIYHIPYVCWIVDSPVLELYSRAIGNPWNRIFLFDYALYEEFLPKNPDCIFYLPLGANYERLDAVIASITEEERQRFQAEVSFIGSLYTEKCPYNWLKEKGTYLKGYLDALIEAQLNVYGYNFLEECITEEILADFKSKVPFYQFPYQLPEEAKKSEKAVMAQFYLGNKVTEQERLRLLRAVSEEFPLSLYTGSDARGIPRAEHKGLVDSQTQMPKVFHLSKINLNFTSKPIRTGLPQRIWDILGAGGFVLTNFQAELPEYFEIGKDLEVYASQAELLEKIQYYLTHEEERKAIAKRGYEKAKNCYGLKHRLEQILEKV